MLFNQFNRGQKVDGKLSTSVIIRFPGSQTLGELLCRCVSNHAVWHRCRPEHTSIVFLGRHSRCHELSLQRTELTITSVSSLLANQLVASESQRARDHGHQSAVVTPLGNLSFWLLSHCSRHL